MTDHKPLSEGEIETIREARELLKAYICDVEDGIEEEQTKGRRVVAELYALLGEPITHDNWRTRPTPVATPKPLDGEAATIADYEECLADHRLLCRRLDVALNGDDAASGPSLCDIVGQVEGLAIMHGPLIPSLPAQTCEATESEAEKFFAGVYVQGWNQHIGHDGATAIQNALAKARLRIVKDEAPQPDQFNAGIEAAAQWLADNGMPGNTASVAAMRGLKK